MIYSSFIHLPKNVMNSLFLIWQFLRKLDIVLPEDLAIPLLGINPEDAPICNKNTCSTVFTAVLFIIDINCKEHRCTITED